MKHNIIDIHNHPNWHKMTVDRLVQNMDEHGIDKTCLLSWEPTEEEFNVVPRYHEAMDPRGFCAPLWMVVEGCVKHPNRFIPGWAPDPRDRYARAKLKSAVDLHGIKIYGELKCRMRYDSPDAIAMFHYCSELGLPVLFHLEAPEYRLRQQCKGPYEWPEWYGGDITVVDNMCRLCPKTTFIGHGPGFWREMSGGARRNAQVYPAGAIRPGSRLLKIMRKHDHLYCDISAGSGLNAFTRDLEHAKTFLTEFQDRVLHGRDTFDGTHIAMLKDLNLNKTICDKILFGNAKKILKIQS